MRRGRRASWRGLPRWLAAASPLALLWPGVRELVEARMSFHMIGEIPMLVVAGWCAGRLRERLGLGRGLTLACRRFDWRGWTGATLCSCVAGAWMVPSLLDASLLWTEFAAGKYASCWLAGWMLAGSMRRMDAEIVLFFGGNLAWMMASAGMLYLNAPARLCANYLRDDQQHAGLGLIVLAIALGAMTCRRALRPDSGRPARPGDLTIGS